MLFDKVNSTAPNVAIKKGSFKTRNKRKKLPQNPITFITRFVKSDARKAQVNAMSLGFVDKCTIGSVAYIAGLFEKRNGRRH